MYIVKARVRQVLVDSCGEICALLCEGKPKKDVKYAVLDGARVLKWCYKRSECIRYAESLTPSSGFFGFIEKSVVGTVEPVSVKFCDAPVLFIE